MTRVYSSLTLCCLLALAACAGPDQGAERRLQARLDALDKRLDVVDARLGDLAREQASGQRLRDDLQALDRRLGALDARTTEALDSAAKAAASRPSAPATTGKAARRQVREWYLARRRALLLGTPLPD